MIVQNLLYSEKNGRSDYSEQRLGCDSFFLIRPCLKCFSCRDCSVRPSLRIGLGPGHVSGLQHPLVLRQAGQRLCAVLVRRLQRQQEPLRHRGGVQEDVCGQAYRYVVLHACCFNVVCSSRLSVSPVNRLLHVSFAPTRLNFFVCSSSRRLSGVVCPTCVADPPGEGQLITSRFLA